MGVYITIQYVESSITVPVTYKCPHCGKTIHDEYECTVKNPARKNVHEKNRKQLAEQLALMAKNTEPESYRQLKLDAFCSCCGKLQPWSKRSSGLVNKIFKVSGFFSAFFLFMGSIAGSTSVLGSHLLFYAPMLVFAIVGGIKLYWDIRFDRTLSEMKPEEFPIFHLEEILK